MASCKGGALIAGIMWSVRYDAWIGLEELLFASLGLEKSSLNLLGPGWRYIRALK